jgi:hypothetical protein
MKQTREKNSPSTQIEMGLAPVEVMLANIAAGTDAGNKILNSLKYYARKESDILAKPMTTIITAGFNSLIVAKSKSQVTLDRISTILASWFSHQYENDARMMGIMENKKGNDKIGLDIPKLIDIKVNAGMFDKSGKEGAAKGDSGGKDKMKVLDILGISKAVMDLDSKLKKPFFRKIETLTRVLHKLLEIDEKKVKPFTTAMDSLVKNIEKIDKPMRSISISMLMLAGALVVMGLAAMIPTLALSLALVVGFTWGMAKVLDKKTLPDNMLEFAGGIGILTLSLVAMSFVEWGSLLKMGVFLGMMYMFLAGKKKNDLPKGMVSFAGGIGILTLALVVMNVVQWESVMKMVVFMAAVAGIMILLDKFTGGKGMTKGLPGFALGIGILTLAMLAMAYIQWETVFKMVVFMGAVAGMMILLDKFGGGSGATKGLPGFALGIGILTLAMLAMAYIPWDSVFKMLAFIAGVVLVMTFASKVGGSGKIGNDLIKLSVSMIVMVGALWLFKKAGITWGDLAMLGAVIVGMALIATVLGAPPIAAMAKIGAMTLLMISGALVLTGLGLILVSKAFSMISGLEINMGNLMTFLGALSITFVTLALLAAPAVLALVASALILSTMLLTLAVAGIMAGITAMGPYDTGGLIPCLWLLIPTMATMLPIAVLAIPGATLTWVVMKIIQGVATSVNKISTMKYDPAGANNLVTSITKVIEGIDSLGFVQLTKVAAKAALLLPVASVLEKLSRVNFSQTQAGDGIGSFLDKMADPGRWAIIHANMTLMATNMRMVAGAVNTIDLNKMMALERSLKLMADKESNKNLQELIDKLRQLIDAMNGNTKAIEKEEGKQGETSYTPVLSSGTSPAKIANNTPAQAPQQGEFTSLVEQLQAINSKLAGRLKVMVADGNGNSIR